MVEAADSLLALWCSYPPDSLLQSRSDVAARTELSLDRFTRFVAGPATQITYANLRPATPEASLALLSLCTDALSRHLTDSAAFTLLYAFFALHLVGVQTEDEATDCGGGSDVGGSNGEGEGGGHEGGSKRGGAEEVDDRVGADEGGSDEGSGGQGGGCEGGVCKGGMGEGDGGMVGGDGNGGEGDRVYSAVDKLPPPLPWSLRRLPILQRKRCLRCECELPRDGGRVGPICSICFHQSVQIVQGLMQNCRLDVSEWALIAAKESLAQDGSRFDFLNEFGRHALPADDSVWRGAEYHAQVLAHCSGRASADVNPKAGPIDDSLLSPALQKILGEGYRLRSIVGSGTEAVRSLWDVADGFAPSQAASRLIILEGAYGGGSGPLQAVCGLPFVRERAFACSAASRFEGCFVEAPYRRMDLEDEIAELEEVEAEMVADGVGGQGGADGMALLTAKESRCLRLLEDKLCELRGAGEAVAGVLVEFVRAGDGFCLSPAYVAALSNWARQHQLLLCEDAVLLGLRCGSPFASLLYPNLQCHWIAIGKLWGFSGIVQCTAIDHYGGYQRAPEWLNGYITCAISPLEVVRCRAILAAVLGRKLCANASASGRRLKLKLRAQGLDVWGVGLALWFDPASGSVQNACALHNRLLPALTLGSDPSELDEVRVRRGLYSHLPSLFNDTTCVGGQLPPQHTTASEAIAWHAEAITMRATRCRAVKTKMRWFNPTPTPNLDSF